MIEMLTIEKYHRKALAGSGRNTIRKFSDKYAELEPGDLVKMIYVSQMANSEQPEIIDATEILEIASVVIASYEVIQANHFHLNHGRFAKQTDMDSFFREVYPKCSRDDMFMAIYFK
jgi:hypothetical protein